MASVEVVEKPTLGEFEKFESKQYFVRTTAGYETWVKLNKKEITAMQARMSGVFKIDGSMLKLLPKLGQIQAFMDMAGLVPVEY